MRPTELNFRSPKEKTPDAGLPVVTFDGRRLTFAQSHLKGNLPQSKRFAQYEVEAKRTGYMVGPGTYNNQSADLANSKSKIGPVYRDYHGGKDVTNNGYYFYGSHLVFEPAFVMKSRSVKAKDCSVDASQLLTRPQTCNNFYSKRSSKPSRPASAKSPYLTRTKNTVG
jgi:hypothetical protein